MCNTCGCGSEASLVAAMDCAPPIEQGQTLDSTANHDHRHAGHGVSRFLRVERDILARNDHYAADNRRYFAQHGIFVLNLLSSPGSGKTTLLCRTLAQLPKELLVTVIEGDQRTTLDAERIRATGAAAVQINTGKGCHLDAHQVRHAIGDLTPADDSLLLIENVGNLVCPAAFDLGEAHKVVILSVVEGEDKPLKYPHIFRAASLLLLNKIDLLPYVTFDCPQAIANARRINPQIEVIEVSASSGAGLAEWIAWLQAGCAAQQQSKPTSSTVAERCIARVEGRFSAISRG